jgi:hypothetical protein
MASAPPAPRRLAGDLRAAAVAAFVTWHLFFLVFRGGLDLDPEGIRARLKNVPGWAAVEPVFRPVDRASWRYGALLGIEQGWNLFSGPLSRAAGFPAARVEFADGTSDSVFSDNEPERGAFFRAGGWRLRKLEDYLAATDAERLAASDERPLWGAYARWCARRWRAAHPDDPRRPVRVVLVVRTLPFPAPGDDPCSRPEATVTELGTFDPDGRPQ